MAQRLQLAPEAVFALVLLAAGDRRALPPPWPATALSPVAAMLWSAVAAMLAGDSDDVAPPSAVAASSICFTATARPSASMPRKTEPYAPVPSSSRKPDVIADTCAAVNAMLAGSGGGEG